MTLFPNPVKSELVRGQISSGLRPTHEFSFFVSPKIHLGVARSVNASIRELSTHRCVRPLISTDCSTGFPQRKPSENDPTAVTAMFADVGYYRGHSEKIKELGLASFLPQEAAAPGDGMGAPNNPRSSKTG
jgi:hypothetical protein